MDEIRIEPYCDEKISAKDWIKEKRDKVSEFFEEHNDDIKKYVALFGLTAAAIMFRNNRLYQRDLKNYNKGVSDGLRLRETLLK